MLHPIFLVAAEDYNIKRIQSSVIPKLLQSYLKTSHPSSCNTYYCHFKILSFTRPRGKFIAVCGDNNLWWWSQTIPQLTSIQSGTVNGNSILWMKLYKREKQFKAVW